MKPFIKPFILTALTPSFFKGSFGALKKDFNFFTFFLITGSMLGVGCGTEAPLEVSSCASDQAVLQVHDGFFQHRCGCDNQADLALFQTPGDFTCQVPLNRSVFFIFEGTMNSHQILFVPPLASSNPIHFKDKLKTRDPFVFTPPSSGLYPFSNPFIPQIQGFIQVP